MHQSWCSTGVAIVHCHPAQLEPRVHFSRKIFTRWLHGVKRKWAETFLLDFLDFWGLQIEQEKLESTICQKGTLLSTICQGKKRYSFNYLSLVHFFITWQRLGEVVRLPLLQAPLVLCSLPPMNILYFCSWIIMLDERGSDFRLIQYDWPYKTRPNSAQKKLKIQEMVEIKRKGIY